jgi:transcriptional regulator with XRE-family HTH domain
VDESQDLRAVLSRNIRNARTSLRISQMKLAEFADISVSYLVDIERCRTWVSDKTLKNIARALNLEAYELLIPRTVHKNEDEREDPLLSRQLAELISAHKVLMRKTNDEMIENLKLNVIRLLSERAKPPPPGEG